MEMNKRSLSRQNKILPIALKLFFIISERWHLTAMECQILMGLGYFELLIEEYLDGNTAHIKRRLEQNKQDLLQRLGSLIGIYIKSHQLTGEFGWVSRRNTGEPFKGKSPLEFMLERSDDSMNIHLTLRYLEGMYGGWA